MKKCKRCEIEKELFLFYLAKQSKKDGRENVCIECRKEGKKINQKGIGQAQKKYYYNNLAKQKERKQKAYNKDPEKFRNQHFKYKYDITVDDYNILLKKQNGFCATCFKPEVIIDSRTKNIKNLVVDHCHKTGKVRGLLCGKCNMSLGLVNDDVQILNSMINYLEKNK